MNYIELNFELSWSQNEWELKRKSKRKNLDVTQETVYSLQKNKNILPLFYFNAPLIQLFMFLEFFQPLLPTSLFHTPCIWNPRAVCFIDQQPMAPQTNYICYRKKTLTSNFTETSIKFQRERWLQLVKRRLDLYIWFFDNLRSFH